MTGLERGAVRGAVVLTGLPAWFVSGQRAGLQAERDDGVQIVRSKVRASRSPSGC